MDKGQLIKPKGLAKLAVPSYIFSDKVVQKLKSWSPKTETGRFMLSVLPHLPEDLALELIDRISSILIGESKLELVVVRNNGLVVEDLGVVCTKLVTNNGVAAIGNAFRNSVELEDFIYHGFGTGTTAEAASDSALVTELTTEYATDNTRPTGSNAGSSNVYTSVGTLSPDSGGTLAITEHGLFSASSAGTLLDRSKFSAVNLVAGSDSLQATYSITFSSGG